MTIGSLMVAGTNGGWTGRCYEVGVERDVDTEL